jgi:hypothetical protein
MRAGSLVTTMIFHLELPIPCWYRILEGMIDSERRKPRKYRIPETEVEVLEDVIDSERKNTYDAEYRKLSEDHSLSDKKAI